MALVDLVGDVEASSSDLRLRTLWAKRTFDVAFALPLCVVAIPVILVLAVVLAARHRANPFFVHDRIGFAGRRIAIPKLRTLAPGTDPYADKTLVSIESPDRFMAFLRRTHLDELPQLFLVPLGRLSLVGPRPRMGSEAEEHADRDYEVLRTSVPQGCTGLWQISGSSARVSDNPEFDRFYVAQRTVRLDLWVLWRTLRHIVAGGAADLDDIPAWTLRDPGLAFADAA